MLLPTHYKMKPPLSARLKSGHPLADKLIACYLMNEGSGIIAHDSSGRGHHGTLTGGATWTMGKYGRAVDLDGTDGHIVIPDHADFTPALSPFSISVDVNMHDATSFYIALKGEINVDGEWWFRVFSDDKVYIMRFDESVDDCYIGRYFFTEITGYENQWVNLVATSDGGILSSGNKIYLNGLQVDDTKKEDNAASFVAVENLGGNVLVGKHGADFADGVIDNLMFWRRVLTQSDIARLHADRFCMFEKRSRSLVSVTS